MQIGIALAVGIIAIVSFFKEATPSPRLIFGDAWINQFTPAAISPDGKSIAALAHSADQPFQEIIRVWDTVTGRTKRDLRFSNENGAQRIVQIAFTPDGNQICASGSDIPLIIWDVASGLEMQSVFNKREQSGSFAFFPGGKEIAVVRDSLQIRNSSDGKIIRQFKHLETHPKGGSHNPRLRFSKDVRFLVVDSGTGVSVWDHLKHEMKFSFVDYPPERPVEFRMPMVNAVRGFAISPDGQGLWITTTDGKITEYQIETGKLRKNYEIKPDGDIHVLAVSPKGDKIMTTGFHGNTIVYSFPECKEIKRMPGYGHVQFSPDGKTALTFTKNGRMMLWDLDK